MTLKDINWRQAFCFFGGLLYGASARLWPGGTPFTAPISSLTWFLGLIGVVAISLLLGWLVEWGLNR